MSGYTGIYETPLAGSGIASEIVRALRAYGKALPVAFLAHILRRSSSELEGDIQRLEKEHVLKREGELVSLS